MTCVLIVDDEPLLREELQESLELEDYEVETAGSVSEALEHCEQSQFDVVVTDLKMPNQGGLVLIEKLGEQDFPGKIIVVSGHGAESSREEATALGACACFSKPLDIEALISQIEQ